MFIPSGLIFTGIGSVPFPPQ